MSQKIVVRVDRQVMDEGNDIQSFVDTVRRGVSKNFGLFGGNEKWDVWPVEIHLDRVIVENSAKGEFVMADMAVSTEGDPVFSNVRKVHRQWVIAEPAERSADSDEPTTEVFQPGPYEPHLMEREAGGIWSSVFAQG